MSRKWSRPEIEQLFMNNDEFLVRSLKKLYDYQTHDEQRTEMTKYRNNVGVTPANAFMLSELVSFYNSKGYLTPKQKAYARNKFKKYTGQLTRIANGKQ